MSRGRNWDRLRRETALRSEAPDRHYEGPVQVDPLEPLIQAALAAKRAGGYFKIPAGMPSQDRRRLWRAVFIRLGHDRITGGPTTS